MSAAVKLDKIKNYFKAALSAVGANV